MGCCTCLHLLLAACCLLWQQRMLACRQAVLPPPPADMRARTPCPPACARSALAHRLQPLRQLLLEVAHGVSPDDIESLSATQLRDALLVLNPLDRDWVARVNQAEAAFWQRCVALGEGPRVHACMHACCNLASWRARHCNLALVRVSAATLHARDRRSAGTRHGYADEILGFDCGGQQWVLEVAFPVGPFSSVTSAWRSRNTCVAALVRPCNALEQQHVLHVPCRSRPYAPAHHPVHMLTALCPCRLPSSVVCSDLAYMQQLLAEIEAAGLPAHAPIEQRWTASSSSPMSPASAPPPAAGRRGSSSSSSDTVHSWVGIIMYLPSDDPEQRTAITEWCVWRASLLLCCARPHACLPAVAPSCARLAASCSCVHVPARFTRAHECTHTAARPHKHASCMMMHAPAGSASTPAWCRTS